MGLDNENIHGADELIRRLKEAQEYIRQDVPEVIGTEAVAHFKKSFADEGFTDTSLKKWAPRKAKVHLQTKTLQGQGSGDHLGDSLDYKVSGNTITIYTDKPYAQIHNEGGTIEVTPKMKAYFWAMHYQAKEAGDTDAEEQYKAMALSKKITIIQRQFLGDSKALIETITTKIVKDLNRILNR